MKTSVVSVLVISGSNASETTPAANIIPIEVIPPEAKPVKPAAYYRERFRLLPFLNEKTGSQSWRVTGTKRTGERVRENFLELAKAQVRKHDLEAEWLQTKTETTIKATKLDDEALKLAELAILKLGGKPKLLIPAIDYWLEHGKPVTSKDCPRLDEAVTEFKKELARGSLRAKRSASQQSLKSRIEIFQRHVGNPQVDHISIDFLERYLDGRNISPASKRKNIQAISTFFQFCKARPRHWVRSNPARDITVELPERTGEIAILTLAQCKKLLHAAQTFLDGSLLPSIVVGLIAGLRPAEIERLTWDKVNLTDGEIRIEAWMSKVKRSRTIHFGDGQESQKPFNAMLRRWLELCKDKPFIVSNHPRHWAALRASIGLKNYAPDTLRHTAITHFFRLTGSYGLAAEMFGNSEKVIKAHYQSSGVSSKDAAVFYSLKPE